MRWSRQQRDWLQVMEKSIKICVTGATGYLGSYLVDKLLERGYTVHATLRNLGDSLKVELLKGLPRAETNLLLFEADIYNPDEFEQAIQGCEFVVHMATPLQHYPHHSQYKNTSEAAVDGVKSIVESCRRSGTVKKIIYTASVVAVSPLKDDGTGHRESIDESCWTPLHLSFPLADQHLTGYVHSKTLAEKEVVSDGGGVEVASLVCGLVGGETLLSSVPASVAVLISQITNNKSHYASLRFLEELIGKVPILHVEDVCDAHIFCIQNSSARGRFLCASAYLSSAEIASYCRQYYPHIQIAQEFIENVERHISCGSTKLSEMGFEYKHDIKKILDDSLKCARKMGDLP